MKEALLACCIVLAAVAASAWELEEVRPLTDRILEVSVVDGRAFPEGLGQQFGTVEVRPLDLGLAHDPKSYRVTSPEHSIDFSPARIGRKSKATDSARTGPPGRIEVVLTHWLYLELPQPLRSGWPYTLSMAGRERAFLFDDRRVRSEALHVNQVGFVRGAPEKFVYLSAWLGDMGPLPLGPFLGKPFEVLDLETGEPVHTGWVRLRAGLDAPPEDALGQRHSGTEVAELDLSGLSRPGRYVVSVPGVGCSYPFCVADDVYREPFRLTARALYHQRCGIARTAEHTRWTRPRCHHPADRPVVQSLRTLWEGAAAFEDLPRLATGQERPYWGGYHDAGDWDRRIQHLAVTDALLLLLELCPGRFGDGQLDLPESGNGFPDLLDEARFNLDCYRRMQQPDGGICGGIESAGHPLPGETSYTDSLPLYVYAPDPMASLWYAATAGAMARSLRRLGHEEEANGYLASARAAFGWALAHGGEEAHFQDWRCHAAASLYKATGETGFHRRFQTDCRIKGPDTPLSLWGKYDQRWAVWTYVITDSRADDGALKQRLREACLRLARVDCVDTASRRAFRYGYSWGKPVGYGAASTPLTLPLIVAHHLTSDPSYLAPQYTTCDFMLGGNPLNICWVSGLGERPCTHLHHKESWYDDLAEPVPGLVPWGPLRFMTPAEGLRHAHAVAQDSAYPAASGWPPLELWFGNRYSWTQAEFTVHGTLIQAITAYAYLWALSEADR